MSKLSKRVDKLFLKTHVFVSAKNLVLIRNYHKAILDKAGIKPEDFEEEHKALEKITILRKKDKSIDLSRIIEGIDVDNPEVLRAVLYREAKNYCEEFPNGKWFLNKNWKVLEQHLLTAKEYFAQEKKFNS